MLALLAAPLVVGAVALVVGVGGDYLPASDHALTELQVRDVGRHEVLVGLYSRADWSHPGPALFYALAPFYRLTGGASIGMNLGALAINGAALAGIALVARRHGGTALMLTTALGCALLVRSFGAEMLHDPWNCFATVLPFGLVVVLTWALACGDRWALPAAAGVATFVAQAHVGFVALALPLVAGGAAALAARTVREAREVREARAEDEDGAHGGGARGDVRAAVRRLARPVAATTGVLVLMWLPPLLDVVRHSPSNVANVARWFGEADEGVHSPAEGLRTIAGQFGVRSEWLVGKQAPSIGGESPFLHAAPVPWLLAGVLVAGVVLWRRGGDRRALAATLAGALVLAVAAVARTVGPAYDYRLRWTWVLATLVVAAAAWVGAEAATGRRPQVRRWLGGAAVAALVAVTGVNVATAATAGTPQGADSDVLHALMPPVLDAVAGTDGPVVVTDPFANGSWYARGVVLQLERAGVDVAVPRAYAELFGRHRVAEGPGALTLVVAMNEAVPTLEENDRMRLVTAWTAVPDAVFAETSAARADLDAALAGGEMSAEEHAYRTAALTLRLNAYDDATAYRVAVFVQEPPG